MRRRDPMRSGPARASSPSAETRRPWSAEHRWRVLAAALTVTLVAMLLRLFRDYHLSTPSGRLWGMADDVYISASFARTLAHGGGLRWYEGAPRVEGFSNPLWVLLLAGLHLLPGFKEDHLGKYVVGLNVVVVAGLAVAFARALRAAARCGDAGDPGPSLPRGGLVVLVTAMTCTALVFCASAGFETAAAAAFALAAFAFALEDLTPARLHIVGLCVALAFWTRLDGLLVSLPALTLVVYRVPDRRRLLGPAALLATLCGSQFVLRRWYFGEWLPNTFYLKATGWAFAARTSQGLLWDGGLVAVCLLLLIPGLLLARRWLSPVILPTGLALGVFVASVAYSINNGGDLIFAYGHDRFTAMGSVFLALALSLAVLRVRVGPPWKGALAGAASVAIATGPFWYPYPIRNLGGLVAFFDLRRSALPEDYMLAIWAHHGKVLNRVTRPGARIAVCAAGATIYFSHRGGVDLLGKVEPVVARMKVPKDAPPDARCWRGFPGVAHNKEDSRFAFATYRPEVSAVPPPSTVSADYRRFRVQGLEFFALAGTPVLEWRDVEIVR